MILYGRSRARVAGVLYPPLVVLTIVVTGNHFLLDALAGMRCSPPGSWSSCACPAAGTNRAYTA